MEQQKNNSMYIGIIAILVIILIVMGVLLTGKKEESENVFKCTKTATQNGMELEATYNVYYKDKYVTKVIGDEVITIDDENTFAAMKSYLNQSNSVIENIDYYDLTITEEGNKIKTHSEINYEKIDTDKLLEIDSSLKDYIVDGKLTTQNIRKIYTLMAAKCE